MGTRDSVAVGIAQLRYTAEAASLQESVDGFVVRSETGVMAVGGEKVHQTGSLHNLCELTVFWTIRTFQPVAHHLTRKGIEILAVRLVGATGQHQRIEGSQHGYEQSSQKSFEYIITSHIVHHFLVVFS